MNEQENKIPTENQVQTSAPETQSAAPAAPVAPVAQPEVAPVIEQRPVNPITKAVKNQKFLTICVLYTIAVGLPILTSLSSSFNLDIIGLLFTIGLWMLYANAKNTPETDSLAFSAPNLLSGTVKASRIITLVCSIIFMVCGVLFGICVPILNSAPDFKEAFVAEFQAAQFTIAGNAFRFADNADLAIAILIGLAVGFIVLGILMLVLNYCFFYRYLHRLTYSVCENIKNGSAIDYVPALRKWMLVLGIFEAIAATSAGSVVGVGAAGCSAAAMIVASVWLKESFENN